jgi:O-antigen ligase
VSAVSISRRARDPLVAWLAALLCLCLVLGAAAGYNPKYALYAAVGIAFVIVVFCDLTVGVALYAGLTFLDNLASGGAASLDKVIGVLLFASWAARSMAARRQAGQPLLSRHPAFFAWLAVFVAWSALSLIWAVDSSVTQTTLLQDVLEILLIPIVYGAINSRRDLVIVLSGLLIGAAASAAYGIAHPVPAGAAFDAGRLAGTLGDANEEAAALVGAIVIAGGLSLIARRSRFLKLLIATTILLSVIGIIQTLSRSGLIAFGVALLAAVVVGGRWRRTAAIASAVGIVGIVGYFVLFAPASSVSRVTSSNSTGRNDIWRIGLRMFAANPVLGVGAGNFQQASAQYLERPGLVTAAAFVIVTPKVAHNIYIEELATLGVPGLLLMCGIFVGGISIALRAAHIFERVGDLELELVTRSLIVCLIAFLASDFFISGFLNKQLWLVIALLPVVLRLAQRRPGIRLEPV